MKFLEELDYEGKTVFLRVDYNVPLNEAGEIRDDTRIRASLDTVTFLLERKAKLVVASHLGRPKGKVDPRMSLAPVARRLGELLGREVVLAPGVVGEDVDRLKASLRESQVLLLENVRFRAEETANDEAFARKLAEGVDIYVNDAFGSCHRAHASVEAITRFVEHKAAGFLLKKEVDYLNRAVHDPLHPYVLILGGAKVSDKIPVIRNLMDKADHLLIGGAMAYTFFKAMGHDVGKSLVEVEVLETARDILAQVQARKVHFVLPLDHVLAPSLEERTGTEIASSFPIPVDRMAVDIGPKTVETFRAIIAGARMIVWNGPLGVFEVEEFSRGTMTVAAAVASSGALTIVGGGDSIAALEKAGVSEKITHISTGGGASLEFLAYGTLPGIRALE